MLFYFCVCASFFFWVNLRIANDFFRPWPAFIGCLSINSIQYLRMFFQAPRANDGVPGEKFWRELREYVVDGHDLLPAFKSLYSFSKVCVRFGDVKSQQFTVGVELRQWCVLLPLLFVVYMSWIDSHSHIDGNVTVESCSVRCLLFAIDLVLFASFK